MVITFTHDIPMPTFLPGVALSGRPVKLPLVAMDLPANHLVSR